MKKEDVNELKQIYHQLSDIKGKALYLKNHFEEIFHMIGRSQQQIVDLIKEETKA